MEWFSNLDFWSKFYWSFALVGSLVFIIVMVMTFLGGDADDIGDMDADMDADVGTGFQFISFKNLVGFFTIFGWAGVTCVQAGLGALPSFIIATVAGLVMMLIMATMFYFIYKLSDSGTLNYKNAIGAIGEVYLPIGADRKNIGKVMVNVQSSVRELDALTDGLSDLKSGTIIKVEDVTSNGILIVNATKKPIEPLSIETTEKKQLNS